MKHTAHTFHFQQTNEFNDTLYVGLRLAEVIANDHVDHLDLSQVPKQIRSCLYGCLKRMPKLRYLNMGSGHGGWLSDTFCNGFYGSRQVKLLATTVNPQILGALER